MTAPGPLATQPAPVTFAEAAARAGVALDATQLDRFARYRDLLLDHNTRVNLTAITDPAAVERRLFLDALSMVPAIDAYARLVAADVVFATTLRLVEVGSGAGFPGLPIQIARPELDVTLIEATGKKASFLTRVTAELGLHGATVIHGRAEEVAHDTAHRATYDLATARAVASLPALLELCMPLLREGGRALFPKGTDLAEELAAGRRAAPLVGARIIAADRLPDAETRLVVADKTGPTPKRYPRRAGIPAREPLGKGNAAS